VYPICANARSLPFANYVARFVKPGGTIGIAQAGLIREFADEIPPALQPWWEPGLAGLHSAAWWRRHWERTGILDIDAADSMPEGWKLCVQWQEAVAPDNHVELEALKADEGDYLGYVRVTGRRRADVKLDEPIDSMSVPTNYVSHPLLRR